MHSALIIVWEFPPGPGGIGQHAFSLAYAIHRKGIMVDVVTSGDYAAPSEIQQFDDQNRALNISRISNSSLLKYVRRMFACVSIVRRRKPALVILSGKSALWCGLIIRPFLPDGSVVYGFVHGTEINLPSRFARGLTHLSMRKVDRLVCVSNFTKELLKRSVNGLPSVYVLANGLSIALMPDGYSEPLDDIQKKGHPRLLTVGRISPRKGQFRVVRALPYLRTIWPNIHYHIVGIDSQRHELMSLAKSLGVDNLITIHGVLKNREQLYRAYSSADVFVMLSENQSDGDVEGFGIAILEANYFGVPAIGSKGCGIEDAIRDGFNGYLVDGDDAEEIAIVLRNVLSDESMKDRAKEWARMHDWDILVRSLIQEI
jgi:phosphatidylinositol alpha-1,6-mannosyltransferase